MFRVRVRIKVYVSVRVMVKVRVRVRVRVKVCVRVILRVKVCVRVRVYDALRCSYYLKPLHVIVCENRLQ